MAKFASKCSRFHESNWKSSILFYQDKLHLDKNHQVIQSDQSLNLQKGHLTTPKGSQRLARQVRCDERCSFWASQLPSWYDPIRAYLSNTLDVLPRKVLKVVLNIQGRQHLHLDSFPEISWRSSPPSKLLDPKTKKALENPGTLRSFTGCFFGWNQQHFLPPKKLGENWAHPTKNIPPPPVNEPTRLQESNAFTKVLMNFLIPPAFRSWQVVTTTTFFRCSYTEGTILPIKCNVVVVVVVAASIFWHFCQLFSVELKEKNRKPNIPYPATQCMIYLFRFK